MLTNNSSKMLVKKFNPPHSLIKFKNNDELTNNFLYRLIQYTLPHLLIKKENNSHFIIDKFNNRIHYAHLYYNLYMNESLIKKNHLFLLKQETILKKKFNKYDVNCYTVGTGFYTKLMIPQNIKSIHREGYEKLVGVNEYLDNIGCDVNFLSSRDYKKCFVIEDLFDRLI